MAIRITVTVNYPQVDKKLAKVTQPIAEKRFRKEFEDLKARMITDFYKHPVTTELLTNRSGPDTSGSNIPVSLFGYIGFVEGTDPITPIVDYLINHTTFRYVRYQPLFKHVFEIDIPEAEDIFAITPMPWADGRSWVQGIELGISGVGYTLHSNKGRSGEAIQAQKQIRSGRFRNQAYLSSLLKEYLKLFKKL